MSTTSEREPFVETRFLEEMQKGSEEVGAPYDEEAIRSITSTYAPFLQDGAIMIGSSNRPGTPILFRFMFPTAIDTLDIAFQREWLKEDLPVVQLHKALKEHCPVHIDEPEFTSEGKLAMFQFFPKPYPIEHVFATPGMPDSFRAKQPDFEALDLNTMAASWLFYQEHRVSFVFLLQGPLTRERLVQFAALAGAPEPTDEEYENLIGVLLDAPFYVRTILDYMTGKVVRIDLYFLFPVKLPPQMRIPEMGERLEQFWDIPTYEDADMDILSFGFGDCKDGDILGFRTYWGGLRGLLKSWAVSGA